MHGPGGQWVGRASLVQGHRHNRVRDRCGVPAVDYDALLPEGEFELLRVHVDIDDPGCSDKDDSLGSGKQFAIRQEDKGAV